MLRTNNISVTTAGEREQKKFISRPTSTNGGKLKFSAIAGKYVGLHLYSHSVKIKLLQILLLLNGRAMNFTTLQYF